LGFTSTVQPLPLESMIVEPLAPLVDPGVDPSVEPPVAPEPAPERAVVPVVAGPLALPEAPAPAALPEAPLAPERPPVADEEPERPEVVVAPEALSAEIVSVMPGMTLKLLESPSPALAAPLVPDETPLAAEPDAVPDVVPDAVVEPIEFELPVAPVKPLPETPEMTMRQGALPDALAPDDAPLAPGEEPPACPYAVATAIDVESAATATEVHNFVMLISRGSG
jgi:hypothetical protein